MLMLWSVPRGRSTAFYRMMIERGDFTGVHEPFSHAGAFGQADISGRAAATAPAVITELRSLAATRQVFIKETTDRRHPEALADQRFLAQDAQHTFLIRHPRETIRSYLALRQNPRIHEIGFETQYEVYAKVRKLTLAAMIAAVTSGLMSGTYYRSLRPSAPAMCWSCFAAHRTRCCWT